MRSRFGIAIAASVGLLVVAMAAEKAEIQGSWRLAAVDGEPIDATRQAPGFAIEGDVISGYDGCNQFGGPLSNPQAIVVTQRACSGDYQKLPLDLSNPEAHLAEAQLEGGRLLLPARDGLPPSSFVRDR